MNAADALPDNNPDVLFSQWTTSQLARVEDALSCWVAPPGHDPATADLANAMRYAVLNGGKRLRPLLVLAACEAVNGQPDAALRAACAVELIHAYSLVHDDMPCMDNDILRRGKPTVHVKYGQAQALLAGDALQALAFEILTPDAADTVGTCTHGAMQARLCSLLARAAGHHGMAGGQAIDLASVGKALTSDQLHQMHRLKTGALLQTSVMMGAACGTLSATAHTAFADYGAAMGLAFQVVDDILDVTADSTTLGKTAGKDAAQDKPTFVSLMGLGASRSYANALLAHALKSLDDAHAAGVLNTTVLRALAIKLVTRTH